MNLVFFFLTNALYFMIGRFSTYAIPTWYQQKVTIQQNEFRESLKKDYSTLCQIRDILKTKEAHLKNYAKVLDDRRIALMEDVVTFKKCYEGTSGKWTEDDDILMSYWFERNGDED